MREDIAVALFNLISEITFANPIMGQTTWQTASRRLKLWGDVNPTDQPAVYVVEHEEKDEINGRGLPPRRYMNFAIFAYFTLGDDTTIGGTFVNYIVDAIEAALTPNDVPGNIQNLDGLAYWCRIEGKIFKDPGDIDNQGMVIVPVLVLLP